MDISKVPDSPGRTFQKQVTFKVRPNTWEDLKRIQEHTGKRPVDVMRTAIEVCVASVIEKLARTPKERR